MKNLHSHKSPQPAKRETLPLGAWLPVARVVRFTCCRCRLVTPPGGTVLDPFMGSGSTGKAATLEGLHFLGFDSDKSYLPISMARISHAIDSYKESAIQQSLSNLL